MKLYIYNYIYIYPLIIIFPSFTFNLKALLLGIPFPGRTLLPAEPIDLEMPAYVPTLPNRHSAAVRSAEGGFFMDAMVVNPIYSLYPSIIIYHHRNLLFFQGFLQTTLFSSTNGNLGHLGWWLLFWRLVFRPWLHLTQEAMRPMPGTRLVGWSVLVVPGFTDCFRFAMENHKFW